MKWCPILLALAIIGLLVVMIMPTGNPDWTLPVSVRAQEIDYLTVDIGAQSLSEVNIRITSQAAPVDVNIANASLDVYVTNSTITIVPDTTAVFTIAPDTTAVFNIQGTVDANITNTSLDVNVTNSTLTVNIDGTADVNITNAQLNVQTLKEQASENNKIDYYNDGFSVLAYDSVLNVTWTNTKTYTVYLEMITFSVVKSNSGDPDINPLNVEIWFEIEDDAGNEVAQFNINPPGKPINFDPAIPIPPGWKIKANVNNMGGSDLEFSYNYLFRKP